ncbi:MAG: orotate phosphoribosyltransferase [Saprospiraceae bacterium]
MNVAAEVAKQLLEVEAVLLSPLQPFLWTSGIQSPIYCDNRKVLSYPKARTIVKDALAAEAKAAFGDFDMVAGVATAGIPHGALVADALGLPYVYVRSRSKVHGLKNLVEGHLVGNEKVLVVEDLISTGGSAIRVVEALRERGCEVAGTIAIFNYGFEKAKLAFEKANCPYTTLSNYHVLLEEALKMKYIREEDMDILKKWRENPEAWSPAV